MRVDSFAFLPRSFRPLFEKPPRFPGHEAPLWAPFEKRLAEARVALLTVGVPLLHLSRLPFLAMLVLNVFGVLSDNPRLHAAIAAFALLSQILGFGLVRFRPGSLSAA